MLETLLNNPAFLIIALVVSMVIIILNSITAFAILRGRKGNIEELANRDKKAMDELRQRVEELEKKDRP